MQKEDLSEAQIRAHCPHCDRASQAFNDYLEETEHFHIVCDHHPLVEGHLLIIPKAHISCIGDFSEAMMDDFLKIYKKVGGFIHKQYGSLSSFEHGKLGQTVFHCHIHLLPFRGGINDIIPEGKTYLQPLKHIDELRNVYQAQGHYLFCSIDEQNWTVDTQLAAARFFRDRFAAAVGNPERGDWKAMHEHMVLMAETHEENLRVQKLWEQERVLSA